MGPHSIQSMGKLGNFAIEKNPKKNRKIYFFDLIIVKNFSEKVNIYIVFFSQSYRFLQVYTYGYKIIGLTH